MFPRNLIFFAYPLVVDLSDLDERLAAHPLKPLGPMELSALGFVHPYGREAADDIPASVVSGAHRWITVGGHAKILPSSVVNEHVAERIAKFENENGRKPGGKLRRQMKDDVVQELLPRALVRPSRTDAFIDTKRGLVAVATSSRKTAESVVACLREALGSFPALPLSAEVAPRAVMTQWLATQDPPEGLALGDECDLRDPADSGSVVKVQRMELHGDEIDTHLESGKQATRIALQLGERVSFVFGDDLVVRKLKLLDAALEPLSNVERESVQAELDARFALLAGEIGQLFVALNGAFKFTQPEA